MSGADRLGRMWAEPGRDGEGRAIDRAVAAALAVPGGRVALSLEPIAHTRRVSHWLERYRGDELVGRVLLGTTRAGPGGEELDRHAALRSRVLEAERRWRLAAAGGPGL